MSRQTLSRGARAVGATACLLSSAMFGYTAIWTRPLLQRLGVVGTGVMLALAGVALAADALNLNKEGEQ